MRRSCLALLGCFFAASGTWAQDHPAPGTAASVLKVVATTGAGERHGSAVVIAPDKLVTNCHVIRHAQSIHVVRGAKRWVAQHYAGDGEKDLCLLSAPGVQAPPASIGSTANLNSGELVHAVGFPGGGTLHASRGRVEAVYRFQGANVIQTSAPFDPGASGGGLFTAAGELVGILTFKAPSGGAFHFAIPIDWVAPIDAAPSHRYEPAFWERAPEQRAPFLRAVWLIAKQQWSALFAVCEHWASNEPENGEARLMMVQAAERILRLPVTKVLSTADAIAGSLGELPEFRARPFDIAQVRHLISSQR